MNPLEYVVIAVRNDQFTKEILPELTAIHARGDIRIADLMFIEKADDGATVLSEVEDLATLLAGDASAAYNGLANELEGLLTQEDIGQITERIPAGESVVVLLFEHVWTGSVRAAIDRAGGSVLGGGLTQPETLARLEAELAEVSLMSSEPSPDTAPGP